MRTERAFAAAILAFASTLAIGQGTASDVPMLDPWVPPAVRERAAVTAPLEGAALRAEVERKLRQRFEAAAGPSGRMTREQARAAGLGAIARDFEAIDARGAGHIRFEDYKRFLRR